MKTTTQFVLSGLVLILTLASACNTGVIDDGSIPETSGVSAGDLQAVQMTMTRGPCYLKLTCSGRTSPKCESATYEELATAYLPLGSVSQIPAINTLRYAHRERMVAFDTECNRVRYERTDFACASSGTWNQDSRDQWVEPARVCTGGLCQSEAGPCRSSRDCCRGFSCNASFGSCRANAGNPGY